MVFNSIFFFATLILFLLCFFAIKTKRSTSVKILTLVYSYFFYGMWNPAFLALIALSTLVDYFAARGIQAHPTAKKRYLIVSLVVNLGLLGFFKYYNFFLETVTTGLGSIGIQWSPPFLDVLLPVGISFYTFQTLSYTIDVYRGRIQARQSLLDVAFFVAFFPQLVAGPILRAGEFFPQLSREPRQRNEDLTRGIVLVLLGLFLKVVIADNVAGRVGVLFDGWQSNGMLENWTAGMLFGVQIYADFNGYSLIAIGIARIQGFHIPYNFNAPYAARGFSDFWRRWHISLSSWLRDYLYLPLGGNRKGKARTYFNLVATMALGGIWHGASITFVLWGLLHACYLCIERLWRGTAATSAPLGRLASIVTFLAVSAAWIPFRSENVQQAGSMLGGLATGGLSIDIRLMLDLVTIAVVFAAHALVRNRDALSAIVERAPLRYATVTAILLSLYFLGGEGADFIYFQF